MYEKLQQAISRQGITLHQLADEIGINYNKLYLKIRGVRNFTLDEAVKIHQCIHAEETIEELFSKDENK